MQINIAKVDENGRMINGENVTYAFSGFARSLGESDDSLNMLATQDGRESWSCSISIRLFGTLEAPCGRADPTIRVMGADRCARWLWSGN